MTRIPKLSERQQRRQTELAELLADEETARYYAEERGIMRAFDNAGRKKTFKLPGLHTKDPSEYGHKLIVRRRAKNLVARATQAAQRRQLAIKRRQRQKHRRQRQKHRRQAL